MIPDTIQRAAAHLIAVQHNISKAALEFTKRRNSPLRTSKNPRDKAINDCEQSMETCLLLLGQYTSRFREALETYFIYMQRRDPNAMAQARFEFEQIIKSINGENK